MSFEFISSSFEVVICFLNLIQDGVFESWSGSGTGGGEGAFKPVP